MPHPTVKSAPKIANARRFIESGESVSGTSPVSAFSRLADRLPELSEEELAALPPVSWTIKGVKAESKDALEITLSGSFPLVCQRCFKRLDWNVNGKTTALAAMTEEELVALDDASEMEVVLCGGGIDCLALVEDELLLSLPYSPMHDAGDPDCAAPDAANH